MIGIGKWSAFLAIFFSVFLVFFLSTASYSRAQSLSNISLTSVPEYPGPNQEVDLSLNQYGSNLFGATIRWYANGVELVDLRNERSITITTGDLGERLEILATVTQASGLTLKSTLVLYPVVVDVILEAQTYTPYFYKGRSLPTGNSKVRAVVLVHGGPPQKDSEYTYRWMVSESVLFGGPVKGRRVAEFIMPYGRKDLVVEVFSSDGTSIAKKKLELKEFEPELLFYEESALRGHLEKALLEEVPMLGGDKTIYGEPYYLSAGPFDFDTTFSWKINNQKTIPNTAPNSITFQKTGSGGFSNIDLEVVVEKDMPQSVRNSFRLVF